MHSFVAAATVLALTSLAACSDKEKKEDPAPPKGMSWTVDGNTATASTVQAQLFGRDVLITGTVNPSLATTYSELYLDVPAAVGTYSLMGTMPTTVIYSTPTASFVAGYIPSGTGATTGTGTIVITALTATSVTGTFTFTGIDSNFNLVKSVTNGKFNASL